MINKCKEIAKDNITKPKKQYDSYYFGKGLLRCPYCGGIMVAKKIIIHIIVKYVLKDLDTDKFS